jgi:hypothetical protein
MAEAPAADVSADLGMAAGGGGGGGAFGLENMEPMTGKFQLFSGLAIARLEKRIEG